MTLLMSHLLVGVAGEGSNASGIWYTRSTGSGIFVNVGVRTWRIGSKQDATGVRPSRAGKPGDLVGPWVLRVLGEHKGSLCYMQRRTPQFYARAHQGNLTYPEFLARLEASKLELRSVMLCPEAMQRLHSVGGGDVFPFMAYELGWDSVQVRTSDPGGGSAGASEIVFTGDSSMSRPGCCPDGSARERALSFGLPASTCGSVELRTGGQARRASRCDGKQVALNGEYRI